MTFFKLVIKSLAHYRRMHLAVALAAATATVTLTGALLVGDSVKATLKYAFVARLGNVGWIVSAQERFFTEGLGRRLGKYDIDTAPVLQIRGMVTKGDGSIRVNQVRVLGVDERFFNLSRKGIVPAGLENGKVLVNSALASRLGISNKSGSEVVLRIDNPSAISRNLVLAPHKDSTISMRLPVTGVLDDEHFGRFSLEVNQQEPFNLFIPLSWLQKKIKRDGRANLLLLGNSSQMSTDKLNEAISREWRLEDAEAELKPIEKKSLELSSSRVFIDHSLSSGAYKARPDSLRLLTYFVNELRVGDAFTPYSMVTSVERKGDFAGILPHDMKDDQIVINQWLADDLNAKAGDQLTLTYFVPGGWQKLEQAWRSFKICWVIPIEGAAADPGLAPGLPGLSDSEDCRDWDPSLPINLDLIRDKDEKYWDDFRGTPKAFVTLAAGKDMWANTYGDLTAVRFKAELTGRDNLSEKIRRSVDPAFAGLSAVPVREIGKKASRGGTDFGQLFLGLSMFLIFSAVLLIWLLFVFNIEGRKGQTGMLLAIGFPLKKIRKLYLYEGLFVAFLGAAAGTFIALIYTRLLIRGLSDAWQGAVAGMTVHYSASVQSLSIGFISGFLIALIAMIWTLRRQMKVNAHSLLSGSESSADYFSSAGMRKSAGWISSIICFAGAVLLVIFSKSLGSSAMAGAFFGAGTLLLISIMTMIRMVFIGVGSEIRGCLPSLNSLAVKNSARRRGRSMAVVAMLACGVFMVVAVGANRKDPGAGGEKRASGTGGFSLYAESSVPVVQGLNSESGRNTWGMNPAVLKETNFVSLKVRQGDDASCLNLNRTQEPGLLGVPVDELTERGAFSFQDLENMEYQERPWDILKQDTGERVIPAVGDYPTVYWGLGKKTGDVLIYHNRKGEEIGLRIVGMIRSSILQGSLIISEKAMARYFPEVEGYGAWLIDTSREKETEVSEHITKRMSYAGVSVETAVERLELFAKMEDTYLTIFLVLGGLGLMLGCIGLGLVVARNLLERQGELAMMRAVGFSKHTLMKMVCYEHVYLLIAGLFAGVICALTSVTPSIRAASGKLPVGLLGIMILMIGMSGIIWVVISTRFALKGDILTHLRNE
ncbi:MAG: ABC transporter permease [Desulfobacteraceae bacterium]|jgi:ABC-type antimicrobial peptide transport system permease subunit